MHLNGFDIICDPPRKVTKEVKRTWKERLFTFPFTPFKSHKTIIEWVDSLKDDQLIQSGNKIVCNTKTYEKIRTQGFN